MQKDFFNEKRPHNGLTYNEYIKNWEKYLSETQKDSLTGIEKDRYDTRVLNRQRSSRIRKTYNVGEELTSLLTNFETPQLWMVLTENWCGDSAQNLPYIAKIAEQSDKIDLRILHRDENLDIMDQYLTNRKARSIPKLVAFDEDGNELFQWGPRPAYAQEFVKNELASGREKSEVMRDLHMWYAKNKGQEIENEFANLLSKSINTLQEQSQLR